MAHGKPSRAESSGSGAAGAGIPGHRSAPPRAPGLPCRCDARLPIAARAHEGAGPMSAPSTILVTGGAGFIGSHACVELLDHGYELIVVDDYSNSSPQVFARVERIAGRFLGTVYELDIRDRRALSAVFDRHSVDAVVHFAAHKAVGTSTRMPIDYYDTNVGGTTALLNAMHEHDVHQLVFSSSCSVYGDGHGPLDESTPARPTNPYAASKFICEQILADVCHRHPEYTVLCLRYFNPAGAHPSGLLGEDPMRLSGEPAAEPGPGGHRATGTPPCLRRRLPHGGRDGDPRLSARHGHRRGASRRPRPPRRRTGHARVQPRYRQG